MWKYIGLFFVKIGHIALVSAQWSSAHPQVVAAINTAITAVNPAAGAIAVATNQAVTQIVTKQ